MERNSIGTNSKAFRGGLLVLRCMSLTALLLAMDVTALLGLSLAEAHQYDVYLSVPLVVLFPMTCLLWIIGLAVLCFVSDVKVRLLSGFGLAAALLLIANIFFVDSWRPLWGPLQWAGLCFAVAFTSSVLGLAALARVGLLLKRSDLSAEARVTMLYSLAATFGLTLILLVTQTEPPELLILLVSTMGLVGIGRFALLMKRLGSQASLGPVDREAEAKEAMRL
jgi:hypothetical protein